MKNLFFIIIFTITGITVSAQVAGDFQSRQNGDWDDFNTWNRHNGITWIAATSGQIPTNPSDVWIVSGHTVLVGTEDCKNLVINGTLEFVNSDWRDFYVYGDMTINLGGIFQV